MLRNAKPPVQFNPLLHFLFKGLFANSEFGPCWLNSLLLGHTGINSRTTSGHWHCLSWLNKGDFSVLHLMHIALVIRLWGFPFSWKIWKTYNAINRWELCLVSVCDWQMPLQGTNLGWSWKITWSPERPSRRLCSGAGFSKGLGYTDPACMDQPEHKVWFPKSTAQSNFADTLVLWESCKKGRNACWNLASGS